MPSTDMNKRRTGSNSSNRATPDSTRRHHHHNSNKNSRKHENDKHRHRNHRRNSSPPPRRGGGWFVWGGFSPCMVVVAIILFLIIFGLIAIGIMYSSSAWSSSTTTVTAVVIDSQRQQQPIAGGATISVPSGASIEPPRIDRPYMGAQIATLMDYYQRVNANVTGMNSISRHCYDRMVLDARFKQMTAALNEMFRLDICLSETTEDIIYKAKTWYGFAPKKDGVDIVEALYCTNCS